MIPLGDGTASNYVPPSSPVREMFFASSGLLTFGPGGEALWGGVARQDGAIHEALRALPIALPGTPSAVFELGDEQCLRIGLGLVCGRFQPGRFQPAVSIDKPVAAVATALGVHCLLLDQGSLHCATGELTSSVLAGPLPPAVMDHVDRLAGGVGMLCARSRRSVYRWPRELQHQLVERRALGSQRIRFERVQLPDAK
jgi:hypothetical protein